MTDADEATRYFHYVIDVGAMFPRSDYYSISLWRCLRCNDLFGEAGPGSVRDRNWKSISMRACPNEYQGDLFKEYIWQET